MYYGIKEKQSGKWFCGFTKKGLPMWRTRKVYAQRYELTHAKAQAELLAIDNKQVQKKPVVIDG